MFKSKIYPKMNPFLQKLETILKKVFGEKYKGFHLIYYYWDGSARICSDEIIGVEPKTKKAKRRFKCFADVLDQLVRFPIDYEESVVKKFSRSPSLLQGAKIIGISGDDPEIDDAIALLVMITLRFGEFDGRFPSKEDKNSWVALTMSINQEISDYSIKNESATKIVDLLIE